MEDIIFKRKFDFFELNLILSKARRILAKLTANPFYWASLASLFIALFCGYMLLSPLARPFLVLGGLMVSANVFRFTWMRWKEIFYEASLLFVALRHLWKPKKFPWWNRIDDQLLLGALPLKEKKHDQTIPTHAVLTLLEEFEVANRWAFTTAVSTEDWSQRGIVNLRIGAVDIKGATLEEIEEGVQFIREHITKGHTVYVHCKAGVGRSATVIACYLLKYGLASGQTFHTPEEVIAYVAQQRDQVRLNRPHRKLAIENYFQTMTIQSSEDIPRIRC